MANKRYTREEVEGFLEALERQAREIVQLSERAASEADKHSYEMYHRFRTKVSEFETFSIIIENRLKNLATAKVEEMQNKFDELSVLMLNHFIQASIKFFFVLSASTKLPIGARDIFMSELQRIYNAKQKLENPKFGTHIDQDVRNNLEIAEEILNEIIEKAPSLLNLAVAEPLEKN
jgi:hypothetical protein